MAACAGLLAFATWGGTAELLRSRPPDHTGETRRVALTFDCTNAIFWQDPASGYRWWGGDPSPVPASGFDTSPTTPSPNGPPPFHHAAGRLHFDTATRATFTSDAGGHLTMTRQARSGVFYNAECSIDPSDARPLK